MERNNYWTRRMGRRRLLAASSATGVGAAALALVGCGDDDDEPSPTSPPSGGTTAPGGTATTGAASPTSSAADAARAKSTQSGYVRARQTAPMASINPWNGLDSGLTWCWYVFDHLFYTPLDTLQPELQLATSLESPEPTKFIFKLGEANFHNKAPVNGRRVTSRDVKASLDTSKVQPGVSQTTFWSAIYKDSETPDDNTLIVNLNVPYAWATATDGLAGPINGSIIPEEICADPDFMQNDLIGSGRYEFVSHQNGANWKLKRSETWRAAPEPYLAGYESKLIQEQAAALAAFSAKEIDSLGLNNKLEKEQLEARHRDEITIDSEPSRSVWTVQPRADGRYADPRVRQAINMALDKQQYIDLMLLGDGQKSGPVPPSFQSVALSEQELEQTFWKFDPAEARRMLEAANWDFSQELEIKFATLGDNFSKFAQITQAQLEENLGLKSKLVGEDLAKWLQQSLYGGDYKDLIIYPTLAYETPTTYIIMYAKDIGGRPNWGNFLDDELDAAVKKAETTLDDQERFEAYKELQRMAWEKGAPAFVQMIAQSHTAVWGHLKDRVVGRGSFGLFNGKLYTEHV